MRIAIFFAVLGIARVQDSDVTEYEQDMFDMPDVINVLENVTIHIPCKLAYNTNTSTSWYRNGQKIADTTTSFEHTPSNVHTESDNSLRVSEIQRSHSGEYSCIISDLLEGKQWKQNHLVNVLYPPELTPEPSTESLDVELGRTFILSCNAVGNPLPKIKWYFKDREVILPNVHTMKFNVSQTTKEHAGDYICVANNNIGKPVSAKFQIRVLYLPEVTAEKIWVHSAIGQQTELACFVDANPRAKVDWFHGDVRLNAGSKISTRVQGNKYMLTTKNMRFDDFGNYTCQAANSLGRNIISIHVSGLAKPAVFKQQPRYRTEKSYTLIWEVDSYSPIIHYNLRFRKQQRGDVDGRWIELIIPAGSSTLGPIYSETFTLAGLEAATIYEASVSAKNEFGWNSQSNVFQFATVGTDVEDSSGVVDATQTTPWQLFTEYGNDMMTSRDELEENASWLTDAGFICNAQVPFIILVVSVYVILI